MSKRIAILLTNDDESAFARAFPDDGQKVAQLLQPLRPQWLFSVLRVIDAEPLPAPNAFDGYVITGSPASVNDDALPWLGGLLDFIRAVHALRRPIVGLCFGHQAVARALGGQVQRHVDGWGLGLQSTKWLQRRAWMSPPCPQMMLMAAHNEQVTRLPEGAEALSYSDFCRFGSFRVGDHVFTTQYHPEMTPRFMQALLGHLDTLAERGQAVDARTLRAARHSLEGTNMQQDAPLEHARVLAHWMLQFLEQA